MDGKGAHIRQERKDVFLVVFLRLFEHSVELMGEWLAEASLLLTLFLFVLGIMLLGDRIFFFLLVGRWDRSLMGIKVRRLVNAPLCRVYAKSCNIARIRAIEIRIRSQRRSCRLVSRMALWEGRSPFSSPADAAVGGLAEVLSPSVDAVVGELIRVDRGTNDLPQVDRAHFHGCYERREHLL